MLNISATWNSLREKMVRDPLPPESVAAGWALGVFIGCVIPFGLQLIVSIPLAIWWRVSKVGATIGTLVTNPVSIFFIYPFQCWVGSRMLGEPLTWNHLLTDVFPKLRAISIFDYSSWAVLGELGLQIVGSFFVGGFLFGIILTPLAYFVVLSIVRSYRARKS